MDWACRRQATHLHRNSGECKRPSLELWWKQGRVLVNVVLGSPDFAKLSSPNFAWRRTHASGLSWNLPEWRWPGQVKLQISDLDHAQAFPGLSWSHKFTSGLVAFPAKPPKSYARRSRHGEKRKGQKRKQRRRWRSRREQKQKRKRRKAGSAPNRGRR